MLFCNLLFIYFLTSWILLLLMTSDFLCVYFNFLHWRYGAYAYREEERFSRNENVVSLPLFRGVFRTLSNILDGAFCENG